MIIDRFFLQTTSNILFKCVMKCYKNSVSVFCVRTQIFCVPRDTLHLLAYKYMLCSILKGSSLCPNRFIFKGFTLQSYSFNRRKGTKKLFLGMHFCIILQSQLRRRHSRTIKPVQKMMGAKVPSVVPFEILRSAGPFLSGQFWALWIGTTLQYGGNECSHSEVPFGVRFIPFGTQWWFW